MSWTSEFEPPPPRPNVEGDDSNATEPADAADDDGQSVGDHSDDEPSNGDRPAEGDHTSSDGLADDFWADTPPPADIPDDGPLDPSIFDGLFADLTPTDPTSDLDADADLEADADLDGDLVEAVDLDQLAEVDEAAIDESPEAIEVGDSDADFESDSDSGAHQADADAEATTPAPPVEPAPRSSQADEADNEAEDEVEAKDDTAAEHADAETEAGKAALDDPTDDVGLVETATEANGFDPEETLFEVDVDSGGNHDHDHDHNGHGDSIDATSTISVNGQGPLEPVTPHHPLEMAKVSVDQPAFDQPAFAPNGSNGVAHQVAPAAYPEVAAQPPQVAPPVRYGDPPPRRWRSFALAVLVGAGLGIGGAVVLSLLVGRSDSTEATPSPSTTLDEAAPVEQADDVEVGSDQQPTSVDLVADGRLDLNSLRFEPGSLSLTGSSQAALTQVAAAATEWPGSTVSVVVRTYSEPDAAANLALSRSQAQALVDGLVGVGVDPEAVSGFGVGAPALNPAQPVQNFVVVGAGLQSSALKSAIRDLSPFAIGIDPATNRLRQESVAPLNTLGQAMTADPDTSVSLAAYAYERADADQNQAQAAMAAEAAAAFLVSTHGIDPSRIALLTPGQAPYVVAAETGNHISLIWGDESRTPPIIAEADQLAISFAPGSVLIEAAAAEALDRVAATATETNSSLVIDVHTATESGAAANAQLGERQAAAILDHLAQAGLGSDRVGVYSGGNLRQFDGGAASRVVITPVP